MSDARGNYPTHAVDWEAVYREAGVEPPWTRVWRDGVNVTDRLESWPEPVKPKRKRAPRRR